MNARGIRVDTTANPNALRGIGAGGSKRVDVVVVGDKLRRLVSDCAIVRALHDIAMKAPTPSSARSSPSGSVIEHSTNSISR